VTRIGRTLVACAAAALGSRVVAAQAPPPTPTGPSDEEFQAVIDLVQKTYFQKEPREKLLASARDGIFHDLDPYSRYLSPDDWGRLQRNLAAEWGGIGIHFGLPDGAHGLRILHLFSDSAAGDAGLLPGDEIIAFDGASTKDMGLEEILSRLPGKIGSTVRLSVLRPGAVAPTNYVLVRRRQKAPSVRPGRRDAQGIWSEYMYDTRWRIGYVRLATFAKDTVGLLERALESLTARGMRGLLLDLRDDSGGLEQAAIGAADLFLDSGRIVSEVGRDGLAGRPTRRLADSWTSRWWC
jgi:carboxyl-terminal processing protease